MADETTLHLPPNEKCGVLIMKHEYFDETDDEKFGGPVWWVAEDDGERFPQGEWTPLATRDGEFSFDGSPQVVWYGNEQAEEIANVFEARFVIV